MTVVEKESTFTALRCSSYGDMYSNSSQHMHQPSQDLPPLQSRVASSQQIETVKPNAKKRPRKDRACDLCRRKKIRCDYDPAFPHTACSSCKSYNKACTFNEAAKKRGPPKGYVEALEQRLKRMEKLLVNIAANGKLPPESVQDILQQDNSSEQQDGSRDMRDGSYSSDMEHSSQQSPTSSSATHATMASEGGQHQEYEQQHQKQHLYDKEQLLSQPRKPFSYMGSSSGVYLLTRLFTENAGQQHSNEETNVMPRPVKGDEEDMMVARFETGPSPNLCKILNPDWKLPPKELLDYLVQLYFDKLNPFLPILDEEKFYEQYNRASHEPKFIPIIMCVCRSTFRFLKSDHPLLKKYNITHKDQYFHDICRQLDHNFDLDFLEPTIETIQVLLLQAANTEKWGSQSTDWIVTSIAVKMAQDLGLHRANTQQSGTTNKDMEAKKRIWWSAYIIDRWICASLGRPLTISDADCDVDYPDPEGKKHLSFGYMVKLSCILGDALRGLCTPRARFMSEKGVGLENISRNLEQMLLEWKNTLPADLKMTDEELSQISRETDHLDPALKQKLNSGAGKLHLAYYAVYLLSKRPFIFLGTGEESTVQMPRECQTAIEHFMIIINAIELTEVVSCWSLFSYCISHTQMLLFLNYKNADAKLVAKSKALSEKLRKLHQCLDEYITEPSIIPFLEILDKIVSSDNIENVEDASEKETTRANSNEHRLNSEQHSSSTVSSELQWQDMIKFLAETGYQL